MQGVFLSCGVQLFQDLRFFKFIVGKQNVVLGRDLKQWGLRDKHLALLQKSGEQTVKKSQEQGADLESVLIGIGTDDDLGPAKLRKIKSTDIALDLAVDLHAATDHAQKIGDDIAFENALIGRLHTVQRFAAHGDDRLKFGGAPQLAGGQSRIALHDIQLADGGILGTAVDEFFNAIGNINGSGQLLFEVQTCGFRVLAAALVHQHLVGKDLRLGGMLHEIDRQIFAHKFVQRVVNKGVRDGFLGLVFIGGGGGKAVDHQQQAVRHVLKHDLCLGFGILAVGAQIVVHRKYKRRAHGTVGGAAVLQKTGIVVVFQRRYGVGNAKGNICLQLIIVLVLAVAPRGFQMPENRLGLSRIARALHDVVGNAVLIHEGAFVKAAVLPLQPKQKGDAGVDHRLAVQCVGKVFVRDADIGKDLNVGSPTDDRAGAPLFFVKRSRLQLGYGFALAKGDGVRLVAVIGGHVHIFGGVLRGTGAETIETE